MRPGELNGVRVLVVDDNADTRQILQTWFEYISASVMTAASADEALFVIAHFSPHIVLTDISMPRHDGYWLLRELRALEQARRSQRTPVVAMTALEYYDSGLQAARAGFDGWVCKPFDLSDLSALVERITRRRRTA